MAWNPIFSKCCCWQCILLPNRPPALQVAAPLPGAGCWYRCRACQSIKAARSAALAARIKSDLKQPNRKSSGARLPRLRQSALDGKKVMGARQFQSPWDLSSETPQGKGVHPEKGMRGDASCRQSRDRYNPYRLCYGHARFFVPFFPLFIIIAYLSLPAQGVYIFYNSWFRDQHSTHILLERVHLYQKDSIRPRYKAIFHPSSVRRSLRFSRSQPFACCFSSRGHPS